MRPIIIYDQVRIDIQNVIEYAEKHIMTRRIMLETMKGLHPPIGDTKEYICEIPIGYRVCYSIEDQPAGMAKHISISVMFDGLYPSRTAVLQIAKLFGINIDNKMQRIWIEKEFEAVNFVEIYKPRDKKTMNNRRKRKKK